METPMPAKKKIEKKIETGKEARRKRIKPSKEAAAVVSGCLAALPSQLRTDMMSEMLARSLSDSHFRQAFRVNPRQFLNASGIQLPAHVKVDVHENNMNTLHIILPGVAVDKVPQKLAGKASDTKDK